MKCPKCQFENPEDSLFCRECGSSLELEITCPNCSATHPPGSKFCNKCGHDLREPKEALTKELSFDEKIRKIQKYLPQGLTEKILSQRDRIEGENKQVTVMFCDMEGFTRLVNKLGPEEAYSIMDEIYEILIHKVHEYEGTVNEMTGDGVMALFGAPIALEDAPQRAIRSAHAIHREMTRFNDKIKQEKEGMLPIKMRIGIHTGPVVVGTLGNDLRVEFKAVGDTVNLASRMEDLAEPGATYVTEQTFRLTEGLFRFEALGERDVKGKEEPVKTFRVIGPSTWRTRFDVSAERGLTRFVGRERELELLLDGFERVRAGRGQAFSVVSEAGIGKSRLLYEFRKKVENEDVTFLEGKCLSYSQGVAYHPIIDLFKSNFDIRENDEDDQIKDKVVRGLKQLDVDEASNLPYLLELLSVKDSGFDHIPLTPEGRKVRMIETMIRIPLKGSEIRPLIMAVEDLHWMDKTSEEVLKYLLESISGAKIFLIFTYRPEFVHTWGGRSYHNQVNLNRLSNRESLAMVTSILGTEEIETQLEELILEKTEGVPFFIEEFLKSLKDLNIIEKRNSAYYLAKDLGDVSIPSTIQDVIMARVDSLPEAAKGVLQAGSVIEREFSYDLIQHVTGIPEKELISHLSRLKDSELLYERGIYPESTYIFKHALTREVVYDSILTKRKKKLHEKIGYAIEKLYIKNIQEYYGVVADHFIESESFKKGAEYSKLASRKAQKAASFNEAIVYGKNGIDCLEKLPRTEEIEKQIIDARVTLGLYYSQASYPIESKEIIDPIIELTLERGYKKRIAQIYSILGYYALAIEGDIAKSLKYLEDSIKIGWEINDFVSLFWSNHNTGHVLAENCEFDRAAFHLGKALEINEMANVLWGISIMKCCKADTLYNFQGKVDLGYQLGNEGLQIAEETGEPLAKMEAYCNFGRSCYFKGFLDEAERYLLKGKAISEKINYGIKIGDANYSLGEIYVDKGEYQKGKEFINKAISVMEYHKYHSSIINIFKTALARAKVMNNEKNIDLKSIYAYEKVTKRNEGVFRRYIGELLLNLDDDHLQEAENYINEAIDADKKNGVMWQLGRDYALYSELFKRKGDHSRAKENLSKAIEIFSECGADGWVEKYEKELAALS